MKWINGPGSFRYLDRKERRMLCRAARGVYWSLGMKAASDGPWVRNTRLARKLLRLAKKRAMEAGRG